MMRTLPVFPDLRAFLAWNRGQGALLPLSDAVSVRHEMTAIQLAALRAGGPVLQFDAATLGDGRAAGMPVVTNLFATPERVAAGMGLRLDQVPEFGAFLAELRSPPPLSGLRDGLSRWPMLRAALATRPRLLRRGPVQAHVCDTPDLTVLPVQTPWSEDGGPLITWPVVVTRPCGSAAEDVTRYNLGVYRAQVLGPDRLVMRWLAHRGGAAHARGWAQAGRPMPVAVVLGADPATLLAAALPLPEAVSEMTFSGVLRGARTELVPARTVPLMVPAQAEMVIEGWVHPGETAPEGPFGDHTGYYNAVEPFPVMRVSALTRRDDPVYLTTVTGRPPDEPSVIGGVFNDLALPVIRAQMPEIRDLWLPPAGCSYRIAVIAIDKRYPGQARRVMMGVCALHGRGDEGGRRMTRDRRARALALLARLDPDAPPRVAENLDALSDDFLEIVLGFAFADVVSRPGIDLRTREMLTVAALMATGTAPAQLEFHIRAALNVGVTRAQIVDILLQIAVYAGGPACMNGIAAARRAFAPRGAGGPGNPATAGENAGTG